MNELAKTSKTSDSFDKADVVRKCLAAFGEAFRQPISSAQANIWIEGLKDLSVEAIRHGYNETLRTFKGIFPTIADVRERAGEKTVAQLGPEVAWPKALDYAEQWCGYDYDIASRPQMNDHKISFAVNAAGGFDYIAKCAQDDLMWAKKRFIEAYAAAERGLQDFEALPEGEVKNMLAGLAETKALPK